MGMTTPLSIGNSQGSEGVAPYLLPSGGLEGSPVDVREIWNPLGWGEDVPTDLFVADSGDAGVQVSFSLSPAVPYSDRRASIDNARSPTLHQ